MPLMSAASAPVARSPLEETAGVSSRCRLVAEFFLSVSTYRRQERMSPYNQKVRARACGIFVRFGLRASLFVPCFAQASASPSLFDVSLE